MQMPVAVGIILAIIFLIVFSESFYNAVSGWKEIVIDDQLYKLRIVTVVIVSMLVFFGGFMGLAYATKCPSEDKSGVFENLNCTEYNKIKLQANSLFGTVEVKEKASE